jgi:hypothetical protein
MQVDHFLLRSPTNDLIQSFSLSYCLYARSDWRSLDAVSHSRHDVFWQTTLRGVFGIPRRHFDQYFSQSAQVIRRIRISVQTALQQPFPTDELSIDRKRSQFEASVKDRGSLGFEASRRYASAATMSLTPGSVDRRVMKLSIKYVKNRSKAPKIK